ncbi:hypothetical protein KY325_01710 [Candidatus Woesearchaeota archaeon]|nr:hypothetical protein [Candidatus Woesearchaeota archaeon]
MQKLLKSLETRVLQDTFSPELEEHRTPIYCARRIKDKIVETLRDSKLRRAYLHGLNLALGSLYKPIEIGKRKLKERELRRTHYFINLHYHSGYPFSLDAVRHRDPFVATIKHMRKQDVRILYVTDHDNNFFFWTLRTDPPKWVTKNYDMHCDDWMITLVPKKGLLRKRKLKTLYIMNAQEYHIRLNPDDKLRLNLEMIAPTNELPGKALFPNLDQLLYKARHTFVTLNHPNHFDSFETEKDIVSALEAADKIGTPMIVERFNGGVTPVQGYVNLFAQQICEKYPVPNFVGSDLHIPLKPAGVWIRKGLLKTALASRNGLHVNQTIRDALLGKTVSTPSDIIGREIYSNPASIFMSYVGKKLTG